MQFLQTFQEVSGKIPLFKCGEHDELCCKKGYEEPSHSTPLDAPERLFVSWHIQMKRSPDADNWGGGAAIENASCYTA